MFASQLEGLNLTGEKRAPLPACVCRVLISYTCFNLPAKLSE